MNELKIRYEVLRALAIAYLVFPSVVFLAGWTKPVVAASCIAGVAIAFWLATRKTTEQMRSNLPSSGFGGDALRISPGTFLALFALAVVWCILCGQGGFVCQKGDWSARNAIFRDMITHEWPVQYHQVNGILCYYIGHWLPAAAVGKAVFIHTGSLDAAWRWGNLCLLLWTTLGVLLTWMVLFTTGGLKSRGVLFQLAVLFILFGGLDAVGHLVRCGWKYVYYHECSNVFLWHLDSWFGKGRADCGFEFSSMTTLLSWVFNQTISPWLATAVVLAEKNARAFGVIVFPVLICGIFPFIGIGALLFFIVMWALLRPGAEVQRRSLLADAFSPSNLVSLFAIALPTALYLLANMNTSKVDLFLRWHVGTIGAYVFFLLIEMGAFAVYLFKSDRRNPWLVCAFAEIALFQFIYIGRGRDFGMRAIIPAILIVSVFVLRRVVQKQGAWRLVSIGLAVGALGPILSMGQSISLTVENWPKFADSRNTWKVWPDFHRYRDVETFDCPLSELNARFPNGKRKKLKWWYFFGMEPDKHAFYRYLAPVPAKNTDGTEGK